MSAAGERAQHILDTVRQYSGQELSMFEFATLCGRLPGGAWGRDLAIARHLALDEGERITHCYWSPRLKSNVLVHLRAQHENRLGLKPLAGHGRRVATTAANLHRHADWQAENAEVEQHRKVARAIANAAGPIAALSNVFADLAEVFSEPDDHKSAS